MARNASPNSLFDDLKFPAAEEGTPVKAKPTKVVPIPQEEMDLADWSDKLTIKKTFFITQQNIEALRLHSTLKATGLRESSRILNEALSEYLEEEVQALEKVYKTAATAEDRYYAALKLLTGRKA